jgi:hypothetical protein
VKLVEVHRSPIRLFLFGIVGLLLILTAVDVMWAHRVSTPPERNDSVLTTTGSNQQRADYLWGVPLLLAGGSLFGYALITLARREPVLVIQEEGVEFQLGAPGGDPVFAPWDSIIDVYTAAEPDPDGGAATDVVVFEFADTVALPADPWDAEWDGPRLRVNATSWEGRPEDIVVHARVAMEAARRRQRLGGGDDD